jgi:hypothetical protein
MRDRHKQELLEEQLVAMLRMRGQLPRQLEEMYLDQFAKAALPNGSPAEIDHLKALWLMKVRAEQTKYTIAKAQRQREASSKSSKGAQKKDAHLRALRREVQQMHKDGLSQFEMCNRLAGKRRPSGVRWRELNWPNAYRDPVYRNSVKKWLSHARTAS